MRALVLILALFVVGCEAVDHPNRPLPEDFEVSLLTGATLTREDFRGTPWVVNVWVPG